MHSDYITMLSADSDSHSMLSSQESVSTTTMDSNVQSSQATQSSVIASPIPSVITLANRVTNNIIHLNESNYHSASHHHHNHHHQHHHGDMNYNSPSPVSRIKFDDCCTMEDPLVPSSVVNTSHLHIRQPNFSSSRLEILSRNDVESSSIASQRTSPPNASQHVNLNKKPSITTTTTTNANIEITHSTPSITGGHHQLSQENCSTTTVSTTTSQLQEIQISAADGNSLTPLPPFSMANHRIGHHQELDSQFLIGHVNHNNNVKKESSDTNANSMLFGSIQHGDEYLNSADVDIGGQPYSSGGSYEAVHIISNETVDVGMLASSSNNIPSTTATTTASSVISSQTLTPQTTTSQTQHAVNESPNNGHNLTISTDSMSSMDSLMMMDDKDDSDDKDGYQDNSSSHSQQNGGGGAISGSNGNSAGNSNSGVISGNGNNGYISLIPPPMGTSAQTNQCGESLDFKHLFEELCPVCGDKVSGYHYGLLTCESCKGFFKRTVQNKKVYTCVAERQCHIDKTQRKRCPYCRFQKCLEVGMKLEAVRADRMRGGRNKFGPMYKRDRARKLQMMRQRQLAIQAIRTSMGSSEIKPSSGQLSPTGYTPSYSSMNIKQEIQIPQVSSLTQSPDSSPSPIAIALGQVNPNATALATSLSGGNAPGSTNTTTQSGIGSGNGGSNNCDHEAGTGSLQHSTDSKMCFDSGTNPSSTADSVSNVEPLRVSPMIREFVQSIDDREWQTQLFALLQKQSYNQVEVDLFELMCKVLDQNLFSQVDWARNTVFFKDLKVDDQMKLLQYSWSDMLVLDHLHQRIHNGLPDETQLNNGQVFNLLGLGLLGVPQLGDYFNELQNKLQELKFDMGDYVCMKFLILLNPNVRGIQNKKTVLEGHENVQAALLDYTLTCYPSVTDKFSRLLNILPEIHVMANRGEEHLYHKHCAGSAPTQTLLMEMLHAKRKV